ncbi:MAG: hypothetical protein K9N00_06940 [Candidatus Marinimicrobia bacterium]|nr:hypothetical protein [Candidatus Neomarinimicrobiota bacterium]
MIKNSGYPAGKTRPLKNVEYLVVLKKQTSKATDLAFHPRESGIVKEPYRKINNQRQQKLRRIKKSKFSENETGKR